MIYPSQQLNFRELDAWPKVILYRHMKLSLLWLDFMLSWFLRPILVVLPRLKAIYYTIGHHLYFRGCSYVSIAV